MDLRHGHACLSLWVGGTLLLLLLLRLLHGRGASSCGRGLPAGSSGGGLYVDLSSGILIPLGDPAGGQLRRWLSHCIELEKGSDELVRRQRLSSYERVLLDRLVVAIRWMAGLAS